jgi:hypothetical protein
MQVTQPSSDLLLGSVDVLRGMQKVTQTKPPVVSDAVRDTQAAIERAIKGDTAAVASVAAAPAAVTAASEPVATAGPSGWRIRLKPLPALLAPGNDPVRCWRQRPSRMRRCSRVKRFFRALPSGHYQVPDEIASLITFKQLNSRCLGSTLWLDTGIASMVVGRRRFFPVSTTSRVPTSSSTRCWVRVLLRVFAIH